MEFILGVLVADLSKQLQKFEVGDELMAKMYINNATS